jgi:hypothetical protein
MRDWSLVAGDPLSLTFAADLRLSQPDYPNDHVWELDLGSSEPAALAVRTSYGLRARGMRLFYRFAEGAGVATNPAEFVVPPRLRRFYPNYLQLSFVPFDGLEVTAEYWIPEPHVLGGRLTLVNRKPDARQIDLELCGVLSPLDGKSLAQTQQQMINVLAGRTSNLAPVVFLTGGARHGPAAYASLALNLPFDPAMTRTIYWAVGAESSPDASLDVARRTCGRSWDAERARIELLDAGDLLDIYTGNADWDAALAFSQRAALGLFFPASSHLPQPSFVRARQPDSGYSQAGDGSDYPPSWGGQSAFDAYYLSSLLPLSYKMKRGLLDNFLSVQTEDGGIDARPGLAGQRSRFNAPPVLATLAWNHYLETEDEAFLSEVFPKLLAFFGNWLSPAHDADRDGLPAWDHVLQTGFDDHPLFDVWHPWSQGLSISAVFNPELESLLYREASSLIQMAAKLGRQDELTVLPLQAAVLRASVNAAWDDSSSLYVYRDRLAPVTCSARRALGQLKGSGELRLAKPRFEQPVRLLLQVQSKNAATARPILLIEGEPAGSDELTAPLQIERIDSGFQLHDSGLVVTSAKVYSYIERITVEGLDPREKLVVRAADTSTQDVTLFTPLWAHLPEPEQARRMLGRMLTDPGGFDQPFGVPALPASPAPARAGVREAAAADSVAWGVHLPWNQLIGEGLLSYGFRSEAAQLTTRLMNAVIHCLKQTRSFYERYHARTAAGLGERGALTGLAPVGLFLQTLGVQILSPTRVRLEDTNPFPWPVTILYRGLKVVRGLESTDLVFPNGQTVTVTDPTPSLISI